jgi:hypothetical protein
MANILIRDLSQEAVEHCRSDNVDGSGIERARPRLRA